MKFFMKWSYKCLERRIVNSEKLAYEYLLYRLPVTAIIVYLYNHWALPLTSGRYNWLWNDLDNTHLHARKYAKFTSGIQYLCYDKYGFTCLHDKLSRWNIATYEYLVWICVFILGTKKNKTSFPILILFIVLLLMILFS